MNIVRNFLSQNFRLMEINLVSYNNLFIYNQYKQQLRMKYTQGEKTNKKQIISNREAGQLLRRKKKAKIIQEGSQIERQQENEQIIHDHYQNQQQHNIRNHQQQQDDQQYQHQEQQGQQAEQQQISNNILQQNQKNLQQYQKQIGNRGVLYISRIPPYMTPNYVRKLLHNYSVERIYLLPESQWARKNRIKKGGSKRICFREGWIQLSDKKEAKMLALTLNGQKMVHKKGSFYSEDLWNLKYLPKFKWHHLTEKLAHQQRLKKQHLRLEMEQQRKVQEHYTSQIFKSKMINNIVKNKTLKGKNLKNFAGRSYGQRNTIQQIKD